MSANTRFRDAASVHVDVPPERVEELLARTEILRAIDERLADRTLEIARSGDEIEARDLDGHVHVAFRLHEEEGGTRIAGHETVQPEGAIERTKHMLFPEHVHDAFEEELDRLRVLIEAVDAGRR